MTTYVLIHGNANSLNGRSVPTYLREIIYGAPEKITGKTIGTKFLGLVEYPDGQESLARHTMDRMGSFSYGSQLTYSRDVALRELGAWFYHYADFVLDFDSPKSEVEAEAAV